jgi:hypothetical protein
MKKAIFLFLVLTTVFLPSQGNAQAPSTVQSPVNGVLQLGEIAPLGIWRFYQHQTGGHQVARGIGGANDTYAWDVNLPILTNSNADAGQAVYPVANGVIVTNMSGWNTTAYGQLLIEHTNPNGTKWYSGYLHMNAVLREAGRAVTTNDQIGTIGKVSPAVITDHLHFAIYNKTASGVLTSVNVAFNPRIPTLASNITVTPTTIITGNSVSVSAKVKTGNYTFNGQIACALHNTDGVLLGDIELKQVSIADNTSQNLTFTKSVISSLAGSYKIYVKYKANNSNNWVTLSGATNPISISVVAPILILDASARNVGTTAGSTSFNVITNASTWSISSNVTWASVTKIGNTIYVLYQANAGTDSRTCTVKVIAGNVTKYITITQAGVPATLSVSPTSRNVPISAGSTTFGITTNATTVTATSYDNWIYITRSGTTLNVSYQANSSTSVRTGYITVSAGNLTQTITISQAAATCNVPTGLSCISKTRSSMTLSWGSATGALRYYLNVKRSTQTAWTTYGPTSSPSGTITGLTGGGTYAVQVSSSCANKSSAWSSTINVTLPKLNKLNQEGVDDNEVQTLQTYPNPNNGLFTVTYEAANDGDLLLQVTNLQGRIVVTKNEAIKAGTYSTEIDLNKEATGLYFVKITQGTNIQVTKVQIVK